MNKLSTVSFSKRSIEKMFQSPIELLLRCRDGFSELRTTSNSERRRLILEAYTVALKLIEREADWSEFIGNAFWDTTMKKKPSSKRTATNVMRYVMLFVLTAKTKKTASRARRYAGALEPFLQARMEAKQVKEKLKKLGIQRLISQGEQQRRELKEQQKSQLAEDAAGNVTLKLPARLLETIGPAASGDRVKLIGSLLSLDDSAFAVSIDRVARVKKA